MDETTARVVKGVGRTCRKLESQFQSQQSTSVSWSFIASYSSLPFRIPLTVYLSLSSVLFPAVGGQMFPAKPI